MSESSSRPAKLPDASVVAEWMTEAARRFSAYEPLINGINVFPVRDRDTGTNLRVTVGAAAAGITGDKALDPSVTTTWGHELLRAAQAASCSALGNSGTIIVIVLGTLGDRLVEDRRLDAVAWSQALSAADVRASSSISDRAPATMFDALSAAASCPARPDSGSAGLLELVDEQVERAARAVAATMGATETLRRFGVVDSGAVGILVLFESLRAVLHGEQFRESLLKSLPGTRMADVSEDDLPVETGVEVVCTVDANPLDAAVLRAELDGVGESVIMTPIAPAPSVPNRVVPWRLHVHVADEAQAWEVIRSVGEPRDAIVTSLADGSAHAAAWESAP
jgi:dihydroxyacetone kinase-like predicted kinase